MGQLDTFVGEVLGNCTDMELEVQTQQLKLKARSDDNKDGWGVDWIKIFLANGQSYHCKNYHYSYTHFKVHHEINLNCHKEEQ